MRSGSRRPSRPWTAFVLVLVVVLAGCGGSGGAGGGGGDGGNASAGVDAGGETAVRTAVETAAAGGSGSGGESASAESERTAEATDSAEVLQTQARRRALIRTGRVALTVENVTATQRELSRLVRRSGGFISDSRVRRDEREDRTFVTGRLVLRVPAGNFSAVFARIERLGDVRASNTSTEDVSEQLVDVEARLENLRAQRERLRQFYAGANDTDGLLAIQERLRRCNRASNASKPAGNPFDSRSHSRRSSSISPNRPSVPTRPTRGTRPGSSRPFSIPFRASAPCFARSSSASYTSYHICSSSACRQPFSCTRSGTDAERGRPERRLRSPRSFLPVIADHRSTTDNRRPTIGDR